MQTTRRCGWIKFDKTQGLGDLRKKGREERDTEREKIVWERESRALRVRGERRTCLREWGRERTGRLMYDLYGHGLGSSKVNPRPDI